MRDADKKPSERAPKPPLFETLAKTNESVDEVKRAKEWVDENEL